jgi:hypothetical protein
MPHLSLHTTPHMSVSRNVPFQPLLMGSHTVEETERPGPEFFLHGLPLHILYPTFYPQGTHSKETCIWKYPLILVYKIFTPRERAVTNNNLAPT